MTTAEYYDRLGQLVEELHKLYIHPEPENISWCLQVNPVIEQIHNLGADYD